MAGKRRYGPFLVFISVHFTMNSVSKVLWTTMTTAITKKANDSESYCDSSGQGGHSQVPARSSKDAAHPQALRCQRAMRSPVSQVLGIARLSKRRTCTLRVA